jgi:hypothetical protein
MTNEDKWTCKQCIINSMASLTHDQQAVSDCKRAHTAYERGWDATRVNGEKKVVSFVKSPRGIYHSQYLEWCNAMLDLGMRPSTVSVYRNVMDRAWEAVECPHFENPSSLSVGKNSQNPLGEMKMQINAPVLESVPTSANSHLDELLREVTKQTLSPRSTGFRLSVAQKNLSLVLKWAWINGEIGMPPVCPIDRIMLDRASRITRKPWTTNWTAVNSLEEWDAHFAHLTKAAGGTPIAAWEIIQFEDGGESDGVPQDVQSLLEQLGVVPKQNKPLADLDKKIEAAKHSFMARFGKGGPGHENWPYDMLTDALKSSLQHNPTYAESTSETMRNEIRAVIKNWGLEFLARWRNAGPEGQTVELFRKEIVDFRDFMNAKYRRYFR